MTLLIQLAWPIMPTSFLPRLERCLLSFVISTDRHCHQNLSLTACPDVRSGRSPGVHRCCPRDRYGSQSTAAYSCLPHPAKVWKEAVITGREEVRMWYGISLTDDCGLVIEYFIRLDAIRGLKDSTTGKICLGNVTRTIVILSIFRSELSISYHVQAPWPPRVVE